MPAQIARNLLCALLVRGALDRRGQMFGVVERFTRTRGHSILSRMNRCQPRHLPRLIERVNPFVKVTYYEYLLVRCEILSLSLSIANNLTKHALRAEEIDKCLWLQRSTHPPTKTSRH